MNVSDADPWILRLYYISQTLLLFVAICAIFAARAQLNAFKLFEILKFIESPTFRDARRTVIQKIEPLKYEDWWKGVDGDNLEKAASTVCASYDIVGRLMEFDGSSRRNGGQWFFFRKHWASSIVRTHDVLRNFLTYRRSVIPEAYTGFTALAEAARPYAGIVGDPTAN